jgi:2-dehydropantoate 2-reductase
MRISVIGGGGVGSYYAGLLSRSGVEVRLYTRGAHLDAVRSRGLTVKTGGEQFTAPMTATDVTADLSGSAYAILTVKSYDLASIAPVVAGLAEDGTTIVPLLNGVDIADRLVRFGVARPCILEGLTRISVVRTTAGVVERRSTFQRITLGEADGVSSNRGKTLVVALEKAGVDANESFEIRLDLWRKFLFVEPLAASCGLARGPIGVVRSTDEGRRNLIAAVDEVIAVGTRSGARWGATDRDDTVRTLLAVPEETTPSFLLDVQRGGPNELDVLAGTVARLGRDLGIPTPVHDVVVRTFGT